jgi:dUTP pyrophosphatase
MSYFSNIDTEEKAYMLGQLFQTNIKTDGKLVATVNGIVMSGLFNSGYVHTDGCSVRIAITDEKEIQTIFEQIEKMNYNNPHNAAFLRGIFENDGNIFDDTFCALSKSRLTSDKLKQLTSVEFVSHEFCFLFKEANMFDFLSQLYDKSSDKHRSYNIYNKYIRLLGYERHIPVLKFIKSDPNAVTPTKARASDEGYDLTIVKLGDKLSDQIVRYDTCIRVEPPIGYHVEILPRSSLSKSGYMLANSVGLIDSSYRGNLKIVLIKVDQSRPDLNLPFKGFQMIVRKNVHCLCEEVTDITTTHRGNGGFGSTDSV